MATRPKRQHTLKWYQQTYGLPEQTVVNAHRRGWPLDEPLKLLQKFLNSPGKTTAGLQPLMDYLKSQSGAATVKPEQPQNAPERANGAEHGTKHPEPDAPADALIRLEMWLNTPTGPLAFGQMITTAEADQVFHLNDRSWPLTPSD